MSSSAQVMLWTFAWVLVVPTAVLLVGLAPLSRPKLERFASARGIVVTADNGPALVAYLSRVSRWRAFGGAAGWVFGAALPHGNHFLWGAAGYLIGALLAEIRTSVRLPAQAVRRAALTVRRSSDYLSWGARWGPVIVIGALAVHMIVYFCWPTAQWKSLEPIQVAVGGGGVAAALVVLAASRRLIARRPQPVLAPDVAAADDAIRASSLQTIGGAALALMCMAAGSLMLWTTAGFTTPAVPYRILTWLSFGMFIAALYCWFGLRGQVLRRRART